MFQVLNKDLNIRVLVDDNIPNTYYLSYQGLSKCVIYVKEADDNTLIMSLATQGDCTANELTSIIDCFTNFIFDKKKSINGILMSADPNPLLENIGFKLISDDSEYLYKENNKRIKKVR